MRTYLKAIETRYKGYRFRSRLEARWAVFFDALHVEWEYEKEGFDLGPAGFYLPDFWLPEHDCWVEIKGQSHFGTATKKEAELARRSGKRVFIFDHPDFSRPRWDREALTKKSFRGAWGRVIFPEHWDDKDGGDFGATWQVCSDCGGRGVGWSGDIRHSNWCCINHGGQPAPRESPELGWAYDKARGARFEHGERG